MNRIHTLATVLSCAAVMMLSPAARADQWNKKTFVTFSNRVEVPGTVLEPGKYVLKLVDSPSDRHIVQITNERENHVYATVLAMPNYRLEPTGKTVVTFYEMPAGQPAALRAWFYPGDNFGQEFAYPKGRATEISKVTNIQVPEAPGDMDRDRKATSSTEVATAPVEPAQPPAVREPAPVVTETAPAPAPAYTDNTAREMPRTASPMPLVGLIGLLSFGSAYGVRRFAQRFQ